MQIPASRFQSLNLEFRESAFRPDLPGNSDEDAPRPVPLQGQQPSKSQGLSPERSRQTLQLAFVLFYFTYTSESTLDPRGQQQLCLKPARQELQ